MSTKEEIVLSALNQNKSVSHIEFIVVYGIFDPTSIIRNLRQKGFMIANNSICTKKAFSRVQDICELPSREIVETLNSSISEFSLVNEKV